MNNKKKSKANLYNIIAVISIMMLILVAVKVTRYLSVKIDGAAVRVTHNGNVIEEFPLGKDGERSILRDGNENVILVENGSVRMLRASCPDQECVHQGAVSSDNIDYRVLGNAIVCLPNKVVVEIIESNEASRY